MSKKILLTAHDATILSLVVRSAGVKLELRERLLSRGSEQIQRIGRYYISNQEPLTEAEKNRAEELKKVLLR